MNPLAKYRLHIHEGQLCQGVTKTPGRPKYVSQEKLGNYLMETLKLPIDQLATAHAEIMEKFEEALSQEEEIPKTTADILREKITQYNVFKNFIIYDNTSLNTQFYYYKDETSIEPVCTVRALTAKIVYDVLIQKQRTKTGEMIETLKHYINPKKPYDVDGPTVLQTIINQVQPDSHVEIRKIKNEPHPAVLEGCEVPALKIIPFKNQNVTIDQLNPFLKEFLLRVSDHKYFLAHLYTNFIGIKTPCLLYLHGSGNDGKSVFVKMLGGISGSVCNYDGSDKFNYFNMFGKSLIIQNENKKPKILQHVVLKAITGGDFVLIEQKKKDAFTGEVRGQLIIVANDPIEVFGTPDESRRLRYFKVSQPNITDEQRLLPDDYLRELSSTQNEFLNYCRQCYEELKTENGMVQVHANHKKTLMRLRPLEEARMFNTIIHELLYVKKTHQIDAEGACDVLEVLDVVKEKDKSKYAISNFETFLMVDYNIKKEGDQYLGLKRKERV